MPGNYYCYDNFFYKVTNMESPRKNNDCYFYYYSTCTKGDNCTFRHEPSALGCETVCSFWKEGKCLNVHCSFRHMELRKNRKVIPCYWETQPGGCLKPHCPFLHKTPRDLNTSDSSLGESSALKPEDYSKVLGSGSSQNSDLDRRTSQCSDTNFGSPTVDPLVVNFEEESDNESVATNSPSKLHLGQRVVTVKTLEEIKLERIQAESAAYYAYPGAEHVNPNVQNETQRAQDLRKRIMKRLNIDMDSSAEQDFEILSLEEIRKRKKRGYEPAPEAEPEKPPSKSTKRAKTTKTTPEQPEVESIKIKTLAEIRAERMERLEKDAHKRKRSPASLERGGKFAKIDEQEVSSTSSMESEEKIARIEGGFEERARSRPKLNRNKTEYISDDKVSSLSSDVLNADQIKNDQNDNFSVDLKSPESKNDTSKLDEMLLMDDDDLENTSINLKTEEDILKDIDDLLNE